MKCIESKKSMNDNTCDTVVGVQKMNMKVEPTNFITSLYVVGVFNLFLLGNNKPVQGKFTVSLNLGNLKSLCLKSAS